MASSLQRAVWWWKKRSLVVPSGSYLFAVGGLIPFSGTRNQTVGFGLTAAGSEQKILALLSFQTGQFIDTWLWYSEFPELKFSSVTATRSESPGHARLSLWFQ